MVDTFVSAIVTPVINAFPGASVNGWGSRFAAVHSRPRPSSRLNADQLADRLRAYGRDLYFLLVVPNQKMRMRRGVPPAPPTEVDLLTEIRDLLSAQQAGRSTP